MDIEATGLTADGWDQMLCACVVEYKSIDPDGPKGQKPWGKVQTFELKDYKNKRWDDRDLCLNLAKALEKFDVIVSWNGMKFDEPFHRTRMAEWGDKMRPYNRHKDLMYTARFKLRMSSNSLDRVSDFLNVYEKYDCKKTKLDRVQWRKAITGHRPSYDYIIDHCKEDVKVLAAVWEEMRPLISEIK
jgi:uncharacterized protein YprB with RNaseH-like and TPR domain